MLTRRRFIHVAGAAAGLAAAPAILSATSTAKWERFPFTLGVASGAPTSDGFVIWTRLAPEPLSSDPATPGGMKGRDVSLRFEIADDDESMRRVVWSGSAVAEARFGYSAHVQVSGLRPGRPYWYRFTSGDATSRVGRTMTLPRADAALTNLRLGFVSCSNYEQGYFAAYRHLADEQPDVVLYLGDYIYEYIDKLSTNLVRRHSDGVEATDLRTYRNRYAQYRLDEDLQRLHATAPALVTWDDHEVHNDYADLLSQDFRAPEQFKQRRIAAYRAFYEHMPVTPARRPNGPSLRIYDRYTFGNLVEISMTDARQYRSPASCYGPPDRKPGRMITPRECAELYDGSRSMLGKEQEAWLNNGLTRSAARWNVIGQSLLMAQLRRRNPAGEEIFWTDDWSGYPASRNRLLQHIHEKRIANPIVVGGDIHSFWMNDLKPDFDDPKSPVVATEFVGTSVSAHGPSFNFDAALSENPHVRFFDSSRRGYVSMEFTPSQTHTRFQALSDVRDPKATVRTLRTFVVENGRAGAVEGSG